MTTIYKLWFMKYRQPWYELEKPKQDELMGKVAHSLSQAGGKLLLNAVSLWADEQWMAWGIEEYPDIEAVRKHSQNIYDLQWFRYVKSQSTLATRIWPEANLVIPAAPLYRLALFNMTEAWYRLSDTEKKERNAKLDQAYTQSGSQMICIFDTYWSNEEWSTWLVETYPSLEAVQQHTLLLYQMDWYQYGTAISQLGVTMPSE